jgi:hypothetical protein
MDLYSLDTHLKGRSIYVNGTIYPIDAEGVARGLSDADGKKLLTMSSWSASPPTASRRAAAKARIQLVTSTGALIPPPPVTEPKVPEVEPEPTDFPSMKSEKPEDEKAVLRGDWPDPTIEMSKAELQEMADAFGVDYDAKKTTKPELVENIHKAMYG